MTYPNDSQLVTVGPFYVRGPALEGGPIGVHVYLAQGIRRYAEHNGETIPFVDFRDQGMGLGMGPVEEIVCSLQNTQTPA